jgi:hypothetical protein
MPGTGYILWFALPPGTNRTHSLWGCSQFGAVHFWISVTLLAVLAIHVALHWRWLVVGLSRRLGVAPWAVKVVGPTSPTPKHRLTEEEVAILRTWISSTRSRRGAP